VNFIVVGNRVRRKILTLLNLDIRFQFVILCGLLTPPPGPDVHLWACQPSIACNFSKMIGNKIRLCIFHVGNGCTFLGDEESI